ncbi:hypothetical protein B0H14DRAFT_2317826, partial [Mycena olivaceomarginata]
PGLYSNAAKVAALASKLTEEGKDIVLVPHSYSGLVVCEASKGLVKSVRAKVGKQGGIMWIVFVTAVVGKKGQSLLDVMGDTRLGYITVEVRRMYGYGPSRVCANRFLKMPTHSAISFGQKLTYTAYKDIPASYLFCEPDKCMTTELQTRIIAAMESEMGGKTVDQHLVKAE